MTARAVHWHEGMFIRPHHFQAAQRHLDDLRCRNHKWDHHYNWGLRFIDLDQEALGNYRLVLHALEARMRDGTLVVAPRDGIVPTVDLRPVFQARDTRSFVVYLAVPALYLGRRNLSGQPTPDCRYYQDLVDCVDENSGRNPQGVPVRRLNFQILVGDQDQTGYDVIPIARLERNDQADGAPRLDVSFIPPVVTCNAWTPFADGILRALHDRLDKKIDWLVEQMAAQGITFDRQAPGDALVLKQLHQLNEAATVLSVLNAAEGVHPLSAFLELSRLAGQLAIFGATRRTPPLPQYNHDDLGGCFGEMKQHLDALLDIVVEPDYKERPFIGAGSRMQVSLEPAWLDSSWQMFIGVHSTMDTPQCVNLLTKAGHLDMKVGSSDRVDDLYRLGLTGLRFAPEPLPPGGLPKVPGQVYFRLKHDAKNPEWANLKKSLLLAVRINESWIVGSIQNQRRLTIKVSGRNVTMQFSLYVLPEKKA
ncbi:MAG: type VI secretion system baseplate subunit TssK [Planctomycetes bacterium]|nr:type VI secretion system baseplate subunit TssK [Planctomycetota bacterium]